MEIRNGGEALKAFLGVSSTHSASEQPIRRQDLDSAQGGLGADQATLSAVGTRFSDASGEDGVRMDKVMAVQRALAAGTYSVASVKVAEKVMEAMGAGGVPPEK